MDEQTDLIKEYFKRKEEVKQMDEQTDLIKEYFKRKEYVKRPNKELEESFNNLSEEAKFLLVLILFDIVRSQNEQTHPKEKDNTET